MPDVCFLFLSASLLLKYWPLFGWSPPPLRCGQLFSLAAKIKGQRITAAIIINGAAKIQAGKNRRRNKRNAGRLFPPLMKIKALQKKTHKRKIKCSAVHLQPGTNNFSRSFHSLLPGHLLRRPRFLLHFCGSKKIKKNNRKNKGNKRQQQRNGKMKSKIVYSR